MSQNQTERAHRLQRDWERLSKRYLPVSFEDSKWRYSRPLTNDDPEQGWKLHITATVLSANRILTRVAPLLRRRGVLFKAPVSLQELSNLNSGLYYGFSQVGKFITVYPRDPEEAVFLAGKLDRLAFRLPGPAVPYDRQLRRNSSVYYRYGGFNPLNIKHRDGTHSLAIRDPKGRLIPDLRAPGTAIPKWLEDPFADPRLGKRAQVGTPNPLKRTILAYEAISQRGKGGVYRALDISVSPMRLCILKEGRRDGETDWDGRDGYWRVKHEEHVLSSLLARSVPVPKIYSGFEVEKHYYLVMEYVEGQSLQSLLSSRRKKLGISEAIQYGLQLANLLDGIHTAGWVWRDCKPTNIMISESGTLVPVDFEGACPVDRPDPMPWGTPGYAPYDSFQKAVPAKRLPDDLYALGAVLYQLLSGRIPSVTPPQIPTRKLGRRVPLAVTDIVTALLSPDPHLRPAAFIVSQLLESRAIH